jgi:hypothetical protein
MKLKKFWKFIKLLLGLRIKLRRKTFSLYGKYHSLRYILNPKNEPLDLNKIDNILFVNSFDHIHVEEVYSKEKIYVASHKFLFSISYKKESIIYITFNRKIKKYDVLINTTFFKSNEKKDN